VEHFFKQVGCLLDLRLRIGWIRDNLFEIAARDIIDFVHEVDFCLVYLL